MATPLADALFVLATVFLALAQLMILLSTRRAMRGSPRGGRRALEWSYALFPAIAVALVLVWTWRTMHPGVVRVEAPPPAAEAAS